MKTIFWSFIVFLSFSISPLQGQMTPIHTQYYSFQNGLPDRTVFDVIQNSDGMVWVSTESGLSMFDGYQFRNFSNSSLTSLVQTIDIRGAGNLYEILENNLIIQSVSFPDSLEVLNLKTFHSYGISTKNIKGKVMDIVVMPMGKVYVLSRTDSHLLIHQWKEIQGFELVQQIESKEINLGKNDRLAVQPDGSFAVFDFSQQNIYKISSTGDFHFFSLKHLGEKNAQQDIYKNKRLDIFHWTKQGKLWFSDWNESDLFFIEKDKTEFQRFDKLPFEENFNEIWEDDFGNLILSETIRNYTQKLILINAKGEVIDLEEIRKIEAKITNISGTDFYKNFYLSSHNGFYSFVFSAEKKNIRHFLAQNLEGGKFGNVIRGFTQDDQGNIYVAEEGEKIHVLNTNNFELKSIFPRDKLGGFLKNVSCGGNLLFDGKFIWGVSCNNEGPGRIHRYLPTADDWAVYELPTHQVFPKLILEKSKNELWVFAIHQETRENDLFIFNKTSGTFLSFENWSDKTFPLPEKIVNHGIEDSNGNLWLGTSDGLVKLNPITKHLQVFYIDKNDRKGNVISTIHDTQKGKLWLGTYGKGLVIFDVIEEQFSPFSFLEKTDASPVNPKPILPSNNVAGILPINKNEYLVSTFIGLVHLNLKEKTTQNYFAKDGLSNDEYNRLSFFKDKNDNFYFGGVNGFDVFKMEDLKGKNNHLPPCITRFFTLYENTDKVQNQFNQLDFSKPIDIAPNNLLFGFDFMLPNYFNPENNVFQTWLEGWENGFGEPTNKPKVEYYKLPAGKYQLHIKAKDERGIGSMQELIVPIEVHLIFYKTWWFLGLVALALGTLVFLFVKNRFDAIKKKEQEEKEKRENQRRFLELELKTLRMQLNPHFMFNALGAIQFYIQKNNTRLAINYLADFARLMRLFLESSKKKFVLLEEELELIQLYVTLERMRFDNKFEVTYDIDESLDPGMVELPSLLLQPFIENAINHGLRHKEGNGNLTIRMLEDEDILHCVIEDDGIGRRRAAELKKKSLKKHKSRGTQIVQERLEAFRDSGELHLEVKTEDVNVLLHDVGTRVTVSIPNHE